eukprot:2261730-Prymnesium_polylepis.2
MAVAHVAWRRKRHAPGPRGVPCSARNVPHPLGRQLVEPPTSTAAIIVVLVVLVVISAALRRTRNRPRRHLRRRKSRLDRLRDAGAGAVRARTGYVTEDEDNEEPSMLRVAR